MTMDHIRPWAFIIEILSATEPTEISYLVQQGLFFLFVLKRTARDECLSVWFYCNRKNKQISSQQGTGHTKCRLFLGYTVHKQFELQAIHSPCTKC